MPKAATKTRRGRGEVQELVLNYLATAPRHGRFTPYAIAQEIKVTPGSATAAVKALIGYERVKCYGTSPLIVGPK